MRRRRYLSYMLRELTSLFIGAYAALLLVGVLRLAEGNKAQAARLLSMDRGTLRYNIKRMGLEDQ